MTTQTNRNRNRTPYRARARGGGQWTPAYLSPSALYDHHLGGSATETTDASGNGRAAVAFGASTAAPTHVPYADIPFLRGMGAGLIASCASPTFTVATEVDVSARVAPVSWATGSQAVFTRYGGAGSRGYLCRITSTGALGLALSSDGTAVTTATSSVVSGFAAGTWNWVRWTWRASDGRVQFFTAADQTDEPSSWTQLGTDQTIAIGSVYAATASVGLGGTSAGGEFFSGLVGRVIVRTTIAGAVAGDANASLFSQVNQVDAYANTWAATYATSGLTNVVKSVTANDTFGGASTDGVNDTATGPTAAIPALTASDGCTLFCVTRPRATMTTNQTFFSTRNGTGAGVTLRMASATTVVADVSDGSTTATTPAVTITPGTRYVLGVVVTAGAPGTAYVFANNTAGSTVARTGNTETGGALTVFSNSTPANFARTHSRVHYASVASALGAGDIAQLVTYYGGGV